MLWHCGFAEDEVPLRMLIGRRSEARRPVGASGTSPMPGGAGLTLALHKSGASTCGALPASFSPATNRGYPMSTSAGQLFVC